MPHTPGPWEVSKDMDMFGRYTILKAAHEQDDYVTEGYEISDEEGDRRGQEAEENDEGNRVLIQKAPDLLELVEQAFERFTDNDMQPANDKLREWLERARKIFQEVKPCR